MDLLIRKVRPDDAEAIVCVLNPIIETGLYTVLDTSFTVEAEREYIAKSLAFASLGQCKGKPS
jgi:hypothetical protein